jgi:hypothetical protein
VKTEIVPFPFGAAEGYLALRLDCEGVAFRADLADALVRSRVTTGVKLVWLEGVLDWADPGLQDWLLGPQDPVVVGLRSLGEEHWPAGPTWILDASTVIREAVNLTGLATALSQVAQTFPVVEDLVIHLAPDQQAPAPNWLDMVASVVEPRDGCYLYLPRDYPLRGMAIQTASKLEAMWSVRTA